MALSLFVFTSGCDANSYDRSNWGDWSTVNGCSTRERVLIRDGMDVKLGKNCTVLSGSWSSKYDTTFTTTNPRELQIDHIVPIKEAFNSGAAIWSNEQKRTFYNDMDNLIAVSIHSNESKSDADPAKWLPKNDAYVCTYLKQWKAIKLKYKLDMDPAEKTVVERKC